MILLSVQWLLLFVLDSLCHRKEQSYYGMEYIQAHSSWIFLRRHVADETSCWTLVWAKHHPRKNYSTCEFTLAYEYSTIVLDMLFYLIFTSKSNILSRTKKYKNQHNFFKGIVENLLKLYSLQAIQDVMSLFVHHNRFGEIKHYINCSLMDPLQWMGAVRMGVQTYNKNITIIHTTPVHHLTLWSVKLCFC